MAKNNNWKITFSENSNDFTISNLAKYDVMVFLNTTGDLFSDAQKKALKNYFARGKGFVGIHAASDTEMEWEWFTEMIGATFKNHPKVQPATVHVYKETNHPAVKGFKETEVFKDEWYNFKEPVGKHVSVLATVDEKSYKGKKMNTNHHPISWSHIYDGGHVFYTVLGHTLEIYDDVRFYKHIEGGILWASQLNQEDVLSKKWTNLFGTDPTKYWDTFIGAPHKTVKGLENVDPKSDGKNAKPLGLNNDPKKVFNFKTIDDEKVLHISGEIYGALTTKKEYENYHLKLQFKWGEKVWKPRLERKRDNGILYHCIGAYGKFWNVWMQSQEFQVQQTDMGDYYSLAGTTIDIPSVKKAGQKEFDYTNKAELNHFSSVDRKFPSHANKGFVNEKSHGEWNTLELISYEGTSLHIVNGKVVMSLFNSKYKNSDGEILPLTKGRIQLQSEAAEAFYKDVKIKSISKIPGKYKKYVAKYLKN
jgi:type 1 glutamine amidotransferase